MMSPEAKETRRRQFLINALYWAVICAIVYVLLKYFLNLVMPFFVAVILASVARPLAKFLCAETVLRKRRGASVIKKRKLRLNYNVAAVISVIVIFLILLGFAALLVVPLANLVVDYIDRIPEFADETLLPTLQDLIERIDSLPGELPKPLEGIVESALPNVVSSLGGFLTDFSGKAILWVTNFVTSLPSFLLKALICMIATVFIAIDYDMLASFLHLNIPEKALSVVINVRDSLVDTVWQFLKSYCVIFFITAAEITLGLLLIGKPHPFLYGLLIALFDAFPIVGSGMILLPWAVITMITGQIWVGLAQFALYLVVVIVRQIIEPKIVGKRVGLRPIVTLFTMYLGTKLFGAIGLFSLPIACAIIHDLNENGMPLYRPAFSVPEDELSKSKKKSVHSPDVKSESHSD